jgi:hypothetical protein
VIEIVIFVGFIAALVVGSLIANALGRLPTAEQLQVEDQQRIARYRRSP